jgi:hypothetical protein
MLWLAIAAANSNAAAPATRLSSRPCSVAERTDERIGLSDRDELRLNKPTIHDAPKLFLEPPQAKRLRI